MAQYERFENNFNLLHQHVQQHVISEGPNSPMAIRLRISNAWGTGWGTHIPLLASVVAVARKGAVLELGCGFYSTPLLVEMCKTQGREFHSAEEKADWAGNFDHLSDKIERTNSWSEWRAKHADDFRGRLSVVFVDNEPGTERVPNIRWAAEQNPEFIVVHDTLQPEVADTEHYAGMSMFLDEFKYRYDYTHMSSCTSVVSNTRKFAR